MKPRIHFADNYLVNPTNPIFVNLIGAGGTGSQVLSSLSRINVSLIELGHPGIQVTAFDDDIITKANRGRQLFAETEIGLCKSVAIINRLNRFFGTNWKAVPLKYSPDNITASDKRYAANITISCVDNAKARFEIAGLLNAISKEEKMLTRDRPIYWMDYGNDRYTGQVILSTIGMVQQARSAKYITVARLPFVTEEFKHILKSTNDENTPSCSLAEALQKQDLFINSSLASLGSSLLWKLFREGMTEYRGFFLNLKDYRALPIPVENNNAKN